MRKSLLDVPFLDVAFEILAIKSEAKRVQTV